MKDFAPYQESLELKELGFDEPCFTFYPKDDKIGFNGKYHTIKEGYKNSTVNDIWIKKYNKDFKCVTAPTYSQAFRWFREKYILYSGVLSEYSYGGEIHAYHINGKRQENISKGNFTTYEEAELACLRKLIEIVKQK